MKKTTKKPTKKYIIKDTITNNSIKKSAHLSHNRPLTEDCMKYLEGEKWLHECEILEISCCDF